MLKLPGSFRLKTVASTLLPAMQNTAAPATPSVSTPTSLNRRDWLKASGLAAAALALNSSPALRAQHETRRAPTAKKIARISGNENPYGPSQMAAMAMMSNLENACRYPTGDETGKLLDLLAAKNGVKPENIILGLGSSEVLAQYAMWVTKKSGPGEVVTALPGYNKFTGEMVALGSKLVIVPLDANMVHDVDAMAAKVGPDTKCVYICNPNNPTSTIVPPAKLKEFVKTISAKCPVFVDEAYLEISDNFEENTCAPLVAAGHNVVVARTFSKLYGMAGIRMGYGLMPAADAKGAKVINPNHLGLLSVTAATASLQDDAYPADIRGKIKAERDKLCATLKSLGRKYAEPQGNFVWVHVGMPTKTFREKMEAEGVAVARDFPPGDDWSRISIGLPDEMALCHAALKKVFAG